MTPLHAAYALALLFAPVLALAATDAPIPLPPATPPADAAPPGPPPDKTPRFFIREFRVDGAGKLLSEDDIESAVYPFLGPYRTSADVESARAALEQAYHAKGFQTVLVSIPAQRTGSGIIHLQVSLGEIGRLTVSGSRFFSIDEIKREAPSLEEGNSPNFSQVTRDIVALNQIPDRRITPTVKAGETPGTVDVDLAVKDTFPLHGSLEINNRYSANTPELRLNGAVSYSNLWQLGHEVGLSFQITPQNFSFSDQQHSQSLGDGVSLANLSSVKVASGYYLARIPDLPWLTLTLQGTYSDSDVNTLGGIGVSGKGETVGIRAAITLPQLTNYYHSLSLGLDYKKYSNTETLSDGSSLLGSPVTYIPISLAYSGSWINRSKEDQTKVDSETDLNASVNFSIREIDSGEEQFDINRFGSDGGYIYFRGDISHTHELPGGLQVFAKIQGQAANKALVSSEQFSAGGLGTVRGYLESEELGDNGICETLELRTPSLRDFLGKAVDDWRFYIFGDAGLLTIDQALPGQQEKYKLASVGAGTRLKLYDHYNGSFDLGIPLDNGVNTQAYEPLMTFRVWAEF
jgi:hemolysin activation/secretion protein